MISNKIQNWDGTQTWEPEEIHMPKDEEQVAEVIHRTLEERKQVKVIGSALSWSDIIDVSGNAMLLDHMNKVLEVDRDKRQIRLQAGALLKDINEVLAKHELSFENLGAIVDQTAGGYIATGTHGTGARIPILSAYIKNMRLVDGVGEVHELDANHEPELFSAARVNLGCLGVVTEITFQCVDAFDIEERLELIDFDTALAELGNYNKDNDYCQLWWLPYTDKMQVYTYNRTTKSRSTAGFTDFMDRTGISYVGFTVLPGFLGRTFPGTIPLILNTLQRTYFHPHTCVGRSDIIFKFNSPMPKHQESEYAIPVDRAAKAIDETRSFVLKAEYSVNFPFLVRFGAADDIPMSLTSNRDSCYLLPSVGSLKWAPHYFAEFEALMSDYEGRPHWGKCFSRTSQELQKLYPAYDQFNKLRRKCDPHGLFTNSFVERVFPDQ